MRITDPASPYGSATLINLNPDVNSWYVLKLNRRGGAVENYHLENPSPGLQKIVLDSSNSLGPVILGKEKTSCALWGGSSTVIRDAAKSATAYAPLCDGKLLLRNPIRGHRTGIEMMTDFLRDKVPGGEKIISAVRDSYFKYRYQQKAEEKVESETASGRERKKVDNGPTPAATVAREADILIRPPDLGIGIAESGLSGMAPGAWYAAKDSAGIFVSVIAPKWIAPEIMRSYRKTVGPLDNVESAGLVYLVAFDLSRFELRFALGTDHPRIGWSEHMPPHMRDRNLPGPDGIATITPLISTGLISPADAEMTAAAFTGGFKRVHGAFKYGKLSLKNHSSHYGFMENGVVFSRLQPELATIYTLDDGSLEMKTWSAEDNALLPRVRYARQNGVPLIAEYDRSAHESVPGPLVGNWGAGNWSGSEDSRLRTLRAGAALQEIGGKRFLVYAFFWSATPSAMARVFQAYQCRYAIHLDMNAPVHTYLAIYRREGQSLYIQHLVRQMADADVTAKGKRIPRFLASSDDRDFFYLVRKEKP